MNSDHAAADHDQILGELVFEYLAALEAGRPLDRQEMLKRHPQFTAELSAFFVDQDRFDHLAEPLRRAVAPTFPFDIALADANSQHGARALGDFRILREVGRGGMGVVYEAEQISLGRQVALKVLPFAGAMDARQLQRFRNEAHAAAQLHHTNIVPVYYVGCERGAHFYAMQFIQGQSLAEVIAELRLNAEDRMTNDESQRTMPYVPQAEANTGVRHSTLGLLSSFGIRDSSFFRMVAQFGIQAAEALDAAHQQGIVHRDVKPANLLVDTNARLWVTDFGLAQVQGDARMTMIGDLVGTLRYMSPEQALANRGIVEHRTDIYSLGATLYELLTLQSAFASQNRQELLRQIVTEEPIPPRRLNPRVPLELETIVLKAMEKNPEERYGTAQALADDLRRFLNDEPIKGKRPTFLQRARKWARRHRPAVLSVLVSAGIVAVLALVGLTISIVLIERQRAKAIDNFRAAEEQRRLAEERAAEAEANFRRCTQLVEDQFTLVSQSTLFEAPGLQYLRKDLLERALKYYQEFLEQRPGDPKLRVEIAAAYLRLYQIYEVLDHSDEGALALQRGLQIIEGLLREHPASPKLFQRLAGFSRGGRSIHTTNRDHSDPVAVLARLQKAAQIWDDFVRANPGIDGFESDLAAFYHALTRPLYVLGRNAEREQCAQRAYSLREKQARDHPKEPEYQLELARAEHTVAFTMLASEQVAATEQLARQALERTRRLTTEWPKVATYQADLAGHYAFLGRILLVGGRFEEAEKVFRQTLDMFQKLADEFPGLPHYREAAGQFHVELGDLWTSVGRNAEAAAAYLQALRLFEKLVADFPDEPYCQDLLARGQLALAYHLRNYPERRQEGDEAYAKAVSLLEKLTVDCPTVAYHQFRLAYATKAMGDHFRNTGRAEAAVEAYRRTIVVRDKLVAGCPDVLEHRTERALAYGELLKLLWRLGRRQEADDVYQQVVRFYDELAANFPNQPVGHLMLARAQMERALLCGTVERYEEAAAVFNQALALYEKVVADFPEMRDYWDELAKCHSLLDEVLDVMYRKPPLEECHRVVDMFEKRVAERPAVALYRSVLAEQYGYLGDHEEEAGRRLQAEQLYRKAVDLQEKLVADCPSVPQYRLNLARRLERLRNHYDDLGRLPEALAAIRRAIAIQEDGAAGPSEPILSLWQTKGHALRQLGFLQVRLNEPGGAQSSFLDAGTVFQHLSVAFPHEMKHRHFQADSSRMLADLLARAGQDEEAEHAYRRAAQVFDELLRDFPADRPVNASELLRGYTQFILFLKKRDRSEEAQAVLQRAKRAHQRIKEQNKDAKERWERAKADALMKEAVEEVFPSKSE
jgi:serine/threonine protein kinase/tetratricopeptide (TPR) repeat protein